MKKLKYMWLIKANLRSQVGDIYFTEDVIATDKEAAERGFWIRMEYARKKKKILPGEITIKDIVRWSDRAV